MMRLPLTWPRRVTALTMLAVAVATLGAAPGASRAGAAPAPAASDGTRGKTAGMGISPPRAPLQAIVNDLPRLARTGVNTVTLDVWWDVDSQDGAAIHPGSITTSDADLERAIEQARASNLKVVFEPKLWCPSCRLTWRGRLRPRDSKSFFAAYRAMVARYAALAQRAGVDLFFIGSEMNLVESSTGAWREVAGTARANFAGRIAYEVNWDVWRQVKFWDAVDVVSVSAYFPLSDAERPSVADLEAGWRTSRSKDFRGKHWFDEMAILAATAHKPLLFGESGYVSSTFAARKPYDPNAAGRPDQQVQADAYQALLETFEAQPWWMGVVWWEWEPERVDPRASNTYTPRGKIAEQLLTAWYARNWRPGAPGGPTTRAPQKPTGGLGFSVPPEVLAPLAPEQARRAVAADAASTLELRRQRGPVAPLPGQTSPPASSGGRSRSAARLVAALLLVLAGVGHRAVVRRRQRLRRALRADLPAPGGRPQSPTPDAAGAPATHLAA